MREILEMYEILSEKNKEQVDEFVRTLVRQDENRDTSKPVLLIKENDFQI